MNLIENGLSFLRLSVSATSFAGIESQLTGLFASMLCMLLARLNTDWVHYKMFTGMGM